MSSAEQTLERLDAARQKWWLCSLLSTTALACAASLGVFLVFAATDATARLSQPMLMFCSTVWLVVSLALMFVVGRRLLRGQRSIEAAARRVEAEFPQLGSDLINLIQLSEEDGSDLERPFRRAAVQRAAAVAAAVPFDRAAAGESRVGRLVRCLQTPRDLLESLLLIVLLAAIALLGRQMMPNFGSAARRLLTPWQFVPAKGSVEILRVTPGNAVVARGESVAIEAEIANPLGTAYSATLYVTPDGGAETAETLTPDAKHLRFSATVPSAIKSFRYRLEIGDSQTEIYRVEVRDKPVVRDCEITYRYPAYLGRGEETIKRPDLDLEAPQYTVAELRVRPSAPIVRGRIELGNTQISGRVEQDGGLLVASLPLLQDGTFTVRMFDAAGLADSQPRPNRIAVLPDRPPTVELVSPRQGATAAPKSSISVMVRAGDDNGLGRIVLEMMVRGDVPSPPAPLPKGEGSKTPSPPTPLPKGEGSKTPSPPTPLPKGEGRDVPLPQAAVLHEWTDFAGQQTNVARQWTLELKSETFQPGQTLLLRAVAWDKREVHEFGENLGPQRTDGPWVEIKLLSPDAERSAALAEWESLRKAIAQLLQRQLQARAVAATMNGQSPPANPAKVAAELRGEQIAIQKTADELAKSIAADADPRRRHIKRTLGELAVGAMLEAIVHCDELQKLVAPDNAAGQTNATLTKLAAVQERIIDELGKLLDLARAAEAELLSEMPNRSGGDLPDDTRQQLEKLHDKLSEFLQRQSKIIEASEELAKTPVDDFTEEQTDKLKALAAAEDDLARFIKELQSDFSKLPEQDFSNPSTAKELIAIETEIKMAADALTKKSVEIAVPLEQLGYERAEEIKTNLEKWLPDTPDREKWSQEESLTDQDKEAPMAELPGELEDLIGELMEEEENLLEEADDISSSAADSLDKGAGWDAADGPISNMSAKGVTGNRLPNTSEIGGRSGEGRQGKSSGEFVGDEAVGKGGRKTPSRLAPDPVVKGQIKDSDRQPAGGATGGGKESGQGGEGLEGPVPRSPGPRDLERLAGQQATLRNKAEAIDLQLGVANYHHTDLKKLIEIMAQVERDLKAGRLHAALRQREVLLEGLGNVKQLLRGETQTRADRSANLPADVQKEILGGAKEPAPAGWEELNRRYFQRLTGGADEKQQSDK
jgi:hypothetical protein